MRHMFLPIWKLFGLLVVYYLFLEGLKLLGLVDKTKETKSK